MKWVLQGVVYYRKCWDPFTLFRENIAKMKYYQTMLLHLSVGQTATNVPLTIYGSLTEGQVWIQDPSPYLKGFTLLVLSNICIHHPVGSSRTRNSTTLWTCRAIDIEESMGFQTCPKCSGDERFQKWWKELKKRDMLFLRSEKLWNGLFKYLTSYQEELKITSNILNACLSDIKITHPTRIHFRMVHKSKLLPPKGNWFTL